MVSNGLTKDDIVRLIAQAKASKNAIPFYRVEFTGGGEGKILSRQICRNAYYSDISFSYYEGAMLKGKIIFNDNSTKVFTNYWLAWAWLRRHNVRTVRHDRI